jgi:antitoxin component HigA of HigAB toxin-antitoxin module
MVITINNEEEYEQALAMLEQVFFPNSPAQQELMEALTEAISDYEEIHYPIDTDGAEPGEADNKENITNK